MKSSNIIQQYEQSSRALQHNRSPVTLHRAVDDGNYVNVAESQPTNAENFTMDEGDDFKDVDEGTVHAHSRKKQTSLQQRILMSNEKK